MKNKGLLFKALASLLMIPCFVIPFLNIFMSHRVIGNTTSIIGEYGIFADYTALADGFSTLNGTLANIWMTLTSIFIVILAVLALAYIVMLVLDLLKVKIKNIHMFSKILGIGILICSAVALISAVIAVLTNTCSYTTLLTDTTTTLKLVFAVGAWLLIVPVIAGALAMIAPQTKTSKSKKK